MWRTRAMSDVTEILARRVLELEAEREQLLNQIEKLRDLLQRGRDLMLETGLFEPNE